MKHYIENKFIKVGINTFGGSLTNIFDKKNNEEMLYQPIPNSWQGQDVVIFPFVGRLKNKEYTVNNIKYKMGNHGLIRYSELKVIEKKSNQIVLGFKSDEETLTKYPFDFDIKVKYTLINKSIEVSYLVTNTNENDMYYGIGGHPAFICDGVLTEDKFDISGNKVVVECSGLNKVLLNEEGTFMIGIKPHDEKEYYLSKELFKKEKTIILNSNDLQKISLIRTSGKIIELEMFDNEYVAIWSDEKFGNYCALEPWWSLPDFENCSPELSEKSTIITQNRHSQKEYKYKIIIK